jgi:hypothetical protein
MPKAQYFRKNRKFTIVGAQADLLKLADHVKNCATDHAGTEPYRVVEVGNTCIYQRATAEILGRNKRDHFHGSADGFWLRPETDERLPRSDKGLR